MGQNSHKHSLSDDRREESVCPLSGVGIEHSIQGVLAHCLCIDHMRHSFHLLPSFQGLEQHFPGSCLSAATHSYQHQTVIEVRDLVELQHLRIPSCFLETRRCDQPCQPRQSPALQLHPSDREVVQRTHSRVVRGVCKTFR